MVVASKGIHEDTEKSEGAWRNRGLKHPTPTGVKEVASIPPLYFTMASIITFSATDTEAIITWAGTIVGDVMPLLIIIFGITIGAYIIRVIINLRA